jgi:DNA repair exonuclease SbcCD ATPase subunit
MYGITKIELEDFRSFKGKHTFTFPTKPGLYAITGKNLINPTLGPNAIGKSSFLEAIRWCNYGHTSRGLKASDIINYDAKSCSVTVEQNVAGELLTVTRTQSPNSLRLNGTIVDQQTLEKHLRLGPQAYDYAVMFPQFGDAFFDKSPGDKLALFSQIMELDYWLERSKAADDLAKELALEKGTLEQALARNDSILKTLSDDVAALIIKRDSFEAEKQQAIRRHKEALQQAKTDAAKLDQRLATADEALTGLHQRLERAEGRVAALDRLELKLQTVTAALQKLDGLDATCPTCLQQVNECHLRDEKAKITREVRLTTAEIDDIDVKRSDLKAIKQNIRDFEDERRDSQAKQSRADSEIRRLKQNIEDEQKRPNPYLEMIEAKKNQHLKLKGEIAKTQEAFTQTEQDHAAVSFWVSGFKRVRLFIVEQALQQLELEINNCLGSLGLMEWAIKLDVERENKSGGITKGFTVMIYPPSVAKPIRFEAYSGGETQRLRLAGNLGLANLIMERAGLRNTIEFFDEPSAHLSDEGTLDLADTLAQRAVDAGRSIFIIEHRLLDYPYRNTINIIKDASGSRIE